MARKILNTGHIPDIRKEMNYAFISANSNFSELYNRQVFTNAVGDGVSDDSQIIQAEISAISAAGGGTLLFESKSYYISTAILAKPGVLIKGITSTVNSSGTYLSGTRFLGDGTQEGFVHDTEAYAAQPANAAAIKAEACYNFHINGAFFSNFSYAIRGGSLYNTGFFESSFRNIVTTNCSVWSFYQENCSNNTYENIRTRGNASGATGGQFYGFSQNGGGFVHGNSLYSYLFNENTLAYQRGIVIRTYASGTSANQLDFNHIQSNQTATLTTETATMHNASTAVTVTNVSRFRVDMPVAFTIANGPGAGYDYSPYQAYFVLSISGNDLTLARTQRGAAITWTGTDLSTRDLLVAGFTGIEAVGYSGTNDPAVPGGSSSLFQSVSITGLDVEGTSGTPILFQNCPFELQVDTLPPASGRGTTFFNTLCVRGGSGRWQAMAECYTDIDSGAMPTVFTAGGVIKGWSNASPIGVWKDSSLGKKVINLDNSLNGVSHSLISQRDATGGKAFIYPEQPIGQRQDYLSTTTLTLNTGNAGVTCYTGAGGNTWTLPLLTAGRGGTGTNTNGYSAGAIYSIVNVGAGTLTLDTNSASQPYSYSGSGLTHAALTQGDSITVIASYDGTNLFWAVLSNNGVVLS